MTYSIIHFSSYVEDAKSHVYSLVEMGRAREVLGQKYFNTFFWDKTIKSIYLLYTFFFYFAVQNFFFLICLIVTISA